MLSRFGGEAHPADTRDWVAFAHEYLQPMEIGERIFVCPGMARRCDATGTDSYRSEAGLAFGTGAHETTRLCLEAIERHLKPGMTVVDVGTGSGILAEAAVKLGAGRVYACDTDPEAVGAAGKTSHGLASRWRCRSGRRSFSASICRPDRCQHQSRMD